jgi:hypothetical protein
MEAVGRALAASRSSAAITGLVVDWLTNMLIVARPMDVVKMPSRGLGLSLAVPASHPSVSELDAPTTI